MMQKEKFLLTFRYYFFLIREIILQLLFPRACPVCGELLKLPRKWFRELVPFRLPGKDHPSSVSRTASVLICRKCITKLQPVSAPFCKTCGRPLEFADESVCDVCRKKPRFFDRGFALWIHDDAAKKVLYDLKFHNRKTNAEMIGFFMALQLRDLVRAWKPEVILPVPLHKKRELDRGFNQAELIARQFSFRLEALHRIRIPVERNYLLRAENTKPQRTLDAKQRAANVSHAFSVSESKAPPQRVLLIDDIFTSGATIDGCARALKEAGVRRVYYLTVSSV